LLFSGDSTPASAAGELAEAGASAVAAASIAAVGAPSPVVGTGW
jgi:hypothetical protein